MIKHTCVRCGNPVGRNYYYCPDCVAQIIKDNKERDRLFEEKKRRGR